ncbi:MAG TPA: KOW motif-containing protein [Pyrinomonadaceae bacterium]
MQTFRLGDTVRIKSGPFNNFNARVEGINQAKELLKLAVEIYSQPLIKLKFSEVEKVKSS